jgi:uncharacterized protein YkwD
MRVLRVSFFVVLVALLVTACSGSPNASHPKAQTSTAPAPQPAQSTATRALPTESVAPLASQASPTAQPTVEEPSAASPTANATEDAATPAPTATSAAPVPACLDEAVFVGDVTVPDGTLFKPGEAFSKTWKVKNTGTCTWDAGYSLAYISGDIMNGKFNNPIGPISPGGLADISVDLVAPARGGEQFGYWEFQNAAGQRFGVGYNGGGPLWVNINVTFFDTNTQPAGVAVGRAPAADPVPSAAGSAKPAPILADVATNPAEPSASAGCTPQQNDAYVQEMLSLINQARAENGLQPVFLQSQLTAAALEHSTDMACNRFVDHDGSDGSTWYGRVEAQGYANPRAARENIYVGADAQGTFNWWMGSQVHHDNILFPTVTEVGIGYVNLPGSPYGSYFTLVLARR